MALSREGANNGGVQLIGEQFDKAKAQRIRSNLQKAMQIKPNFAPAYSLLSFINLTTGEHLDETVALLKRALQDAPGNQDLAFQLAQLYFRQEKYDEAKTIIAPIARNAAEPMMKQRAQSLLDALQRVTDQLAQYKAEMEAYNKRQKERAATGETGDSVAERPALRRRNQENAATETTTETPSLPGREPWVQRRTDGEVVKGLLTKMECSAKGVTLHVTAGTNTLIFHTAQPERLEFTTFTSAVNESIECKEFKPARPVRIIYRSSTDAKSNYNGEPLAIEFINPEN